MSKFRIDRAYAWVLILYLVCIVLGSRFPIVNSSSLLVFPLLGLSLMYFFPGFAINNYFFEKTGSKIGWHTHIALAICSSITAYYLVFALAFKFFVFSALDFNILTFGVSLLVFVLCRKNIQITISIPEFIRHHKTELIIAAIPLLFFVLRLILNPYVYDIDSRLYFDAYTQILQQGKDSTFLAGSRELFSLIMMQNHFSTNLNFIAFIKFVTPVLFYTTSLVLYNFIDPKSSKIQKTLLYLLLLASPVLIIMNEGVRAETVILLFTLPILAIQFLGLKNDNLILVLLSFVYSLVSFKVHELGVFLIISSLITLIIFANQHREAIFARLKKNIPLMVIVIIPYLVLVMERVSELTNNNGTLIYGLFQRFIQLIQAPTWRWWFLSGYNVVSGGTISWPGNTWILYYAYNGISLFFVLALLLIIFRKNIGVLFQKNLLPLYSFLALYLAVAELLPRLGINYLPNRAWPHICLGIALLILITYPQLTRVSSHRARRLSQFAFFAAVLSGIIGTTVGSTMMGALVIPTESNLIKAIRSLPNDSIVISTQPNDNIVKLYGEKEYYPISFDHNFQNSNDLPKYIKEQLLNQQVAASQNYINSSQVYSVTIDRLDINGMSYNTTQNVTPILSPPEKQKDVSSYDPIYKLIPDKYLSPNFHDTYFIYSFAKFSGLIGTRDWWKDANDIQSSDYLRRYSGKNIIFKDSSGILIKVN